MLKWRHLAADQPRFAAGVLRNGDEDADDVQKLWTTDAARS